MSYIFISYSSADTNYAEKLEQELHDRGFNTWRDKNKIQVGDKWQNTIQNAINNCDAVILVNSSHSNNSHWVEEERVWAMRLKKPIFPLLIEGDIEFGLLGIQYHDARIWKMPTEEFYQSLPKAVEQYSQEGKDIYISNKNGNLRRRFNPTFLLLPLAIIFIITVSFLAFSPISQPPDETPITLVGTPQETNTFSKPTATLTLTSDNIETRLPMITWTPNAQQDTPRVRSIVESANVRSGPNIDHDVIGELLNQEEAQVYAVDKSGWYLVALHDRKQGWISPSVVLSLGQLENLPVVDINRVQKVSEYGFTLAALTPDANRILAIALEDVNVRAGDYFQENEAGNEHLRVGYLLSGEKAVVLGRSSITSWYLVELINHKPSITGWVSPDYVKIQGTTSSIPIINR